MAHASGSFAAKPSAAHSWGPDVEGVCRLVTAAGGEAQ